MNFPVFFRKPEPTGDPPRSAPGFIRPFRWLILLAGLSAGVAEIRAEDPVRPVISLENREGLTIEAEVVSVLRAERKGGSWLCFRKPGEDRLFLYPFAALSESSLTRLSAIHSTGSGLFIADGVTGEQIDFLEEYLAAGPRERLRLERSELKKDERKLEREWERMRDQAWRLQQQLAAASPEMRDPIASGFRKSLAARDRARKQLVLLQAAIRRLEARIETLRELGVPMDDDDDGAREAAVFE